MASDYNVGAMGPTSGFSGGSQSGNDFDFGTPQSLSIDTMMQGSEMNGPTNMANYHSAPAVMPGNMGGFGSAYDPNMLASHSGGSIPHRESMSSMPDGQSPMIGHHHSLSMSSTGPFVAQDRQNSLAGSDTTSPGGQRGHGSIGENPFGSNSNDTVNSQAQGDETNSKHNDSQGNFLPPWSELKTKAGKERKRLPLACIACRRKKIRCSGEKPACKHCLRSRIPCVYKVTTRKAAPRTDYMAMLDKRLKRMEERVIKIIPKEEQGIVTSTGRAAVRPPLPPPPPKPTGASAKKRAAEAAFGDELDEWADSKPISTERKDETKPDAETEPLKLQDSEEHNLLEEGADKLPTKELQEHLSEVFFDYVYCQSYPLLHKPSFMRKLAQGTVPPVLTLAVCAISARFSNHPAVRTEPAFLRGENWASAARDIALRRYDTPNITILIVYLILGLHEFGTCQGGRSWMFGGMAQRMAYALQLHKDLDHEPARGTDAKNELTFTDREIRRRTMWSCFLMDRFNSSGTDRPIFVGEQYIRAQLPIKESFYQMEITGPTEDLEGGVPNPVEPGSGQMADAIDNMGITAYLVRLVAIWGRTINYLNLGGKDRDQYPMWAEGSTFHKLKTASKRWKDALPESLQYTPENLQIHASDKMSNQFIFLHITYNQVVLFMNRFALPTPGSRPTFPKDMPSEFISESSRTAHDAANQISTLCHEAMDHHVVAPFAGYCAFLSSTVHIYGAFSKNAALEASSKQNLAWNVKFLTNMKKYWGMFHFVTENLRDLYRRHADAARSGSKAGKEGDQAIFQYGDWFDRYPHGVSGTDYEEPSVEIKKEPGADAVLGQKSDLQTVEEFFSKLTPPSRAVQNQQQQQQSQTRKMAKKRHSKSDAKQSGASNSQQQQQKQQQDSKHIPQQNRPMSDEMMAAQTFHNMSAFPQHSTAFPPGFQPPPNPLIMAPPQQQVMSQLDRQMVLNSYAGVNPPSSVPNATQNHNNSMLDPSSNPSLDHFDFNAMANGNSNIGSGVWGDPSTAWFMPFNMDPPAVGDDNNLFNGSFDWGNFGGFGDIGSGFPPTGLTPRADLDVDTGQDSLSGDGTGNGLEALDTLR